MARGKYSKYSKYSPTVKAAYAKNPNWFASGQVAGFDFAGYDEYGYNLNGVDRAGYSENDYWCDPGDLYQTILDEWQSIDDLSQNRTMTVRFDEYGIPLADVAVQGVIDKVLAERGDFHFSNSLVLDVLRATLLRLPVEKRPNIVWYVYDKQVHFDDDLRSFDAFLDKRTNIMEEALFQIMAGRQGE